MIAWDDGRPSGASDQHCSKSVYTASLQSARRRHRSPAFTAAMTLALDQWFFCDGIVIRLHVNVVKWHRYIYYSYSLPSFAAARVLPATRIPGAHTMRQSYAAPR